MPKYRVVTNKWVYKVADSTSIAIGRPNVSVQQNRANAPYPFNLGDRIPTFPLPLRSEDAEPIVDLQQIVNDLYEQLGYDYFVDYNSPPPSPWSLSEVTQKFL